MAERYPSLILISETKLYASQCRLWTSIFQVVGHFVVDCQHRVSNDPNVSLVSIWKPPLEDFLGINMKATVNVFVGSFVIGWAGCYSRGLIPVAEGHCLPGRFTPHFVEMITVKDGLQQAINLGWSKVIIDFDALAATQAITLPSPFSTDFLLIEDIRNLCLQLPEVFYCRRDANRITHEIAFSCFHFCRNIKFDDARPLFLYNAVKLDHHSQ